MFERCKECEKVEEVRQAFQPVNKDDILEKLSYRKNTKSKKNKMIRWKLLQYLAK